MTTRKRLTDIVREEVEKSKPESEVITAEVTVSSEPSADWQAEVQQLKTQLAAATALNAQLQTELEHTQVYLAQASQLKQDLDQAVSENQQLRLELDQLKQAKEQALVPINRADQEKLRISQLMYRPVGSNAEQNRINNQNIGWFD